MSVIRRFLASAAVLLLAAVPSVAQPSSGAAAKLLAPFQPIVSKANTATVRIICNEKDVALGTVVAADGYILTKFSELRGTPTVKLGDGSLLDAEVAGFHKGTDLALLKIDMKGLKAVSFADTKDVPVGNWLAAAGTGANPTAVGIVSVKTRDLSGRESDAGENLNRGYIGILLGKTDDPEGGAKVEGFSATSGASKAGLKIGDSIFEMNGKPVAGSESLRAMLDDTKPGEKVKLKVRRKSEELDFTVTLGKRDPDRSDIQNAMGGELSGHRTGFPSVLQTDMILDPKNIGGPVVDLDGKVLGISIARAGRVETWILPSETIRPVLADMKAGKLPFKKGETSPAAPEPRPRPKDKKSDKKP